MKNVGIEILDKICDMRMDCHDAIILSIGKASVYLNCRRVMDIDFIGTCIGRMWGVRTVYMGGVRKEKVSIYIRIYRSISEKLGAFRKWLCASPSPKNLA